ARDHRAHEPLVTRHVDESEHAAVGKRDVRVAELDRHAARLFLVQPIRVDAGQGAHERRLTVIDMSRGTDDHDLTLPDSPSARNVRGVRARREETDASRLSLLAASWDTCRGVASARARGSLGSAGRLIAGHPSGSYSALVS